MTAPLSDDQRDRLLTALYLDETGTATGYHHTRTEVAAMLVEARAEALREAADAWTQGAWSDVLLPKPTPPAVAVIAYANRVGDWLRALVAQHRGGDGGGSS